MTVCDSATLAIHAKMLQWHFALCFTWQIVCMHLCSHIFVLREDDKCEFS